MKRHLYRLLLSLIAVAVTISCGQEEPELPAVPDSFHALYQAYTEGKRFIDISQDGSKTTLTWFDESTLTIADIAIDDCTEKSPKVVASDKNSYWMVGGELTPFKRDSSLPNADAYPLYLYFNADGLRIYLSNSNVLLIKRTLPRVKQLPVIRITSEAPVVSKDTYVKGTISIENPDQLYSEQDGFKATMQIKGRGNSTWGMPKKPYRIKLDSKSEMLGMPSSKNWALLAEYADKSLLRNTTAMELSRICGMKWTPNLRHVEVYLNGSYLGVYTLAEHKEVAKNKVNIDVKAGDMYFELEQNQDNPVCWWTEHGAPVMFSDPENPSAEQLEAAKKLFYDFETALWAKDFATVYDIIDVDSFVNYYIIQELTKNIDGNIRKSTFLTKTVSGKLDMYHVWDFDLTLGNCDYYDDGNNGPTGWWIKDYGYWGKNHGWYYRLFMDPEFVRKVQKRWDEVYPELKKIPSFIDEHRKMLGEAPDRNFQKWKILNQYVWPNYKVTGNYEEEVKWLKEFYTQRLDWLDKHLAAL